MTITTQYSTEYNNAFVTTPATNLSTAEMHGRLRIATFTCTQSGAGDATSSFALFKLPAGRVRLLLPMTWIYANWTTAVATLDLGWDAYVNMAGVTVVADPDGLIDGLDVDAVGFRNLAGNATGALATNFTTTAVETAGGTHLFESKSGVVIRATSQDVALVAADTLAGHAVYVID